VRTSSGSTVIHQDGKTEKKQSGGEGKRCKCGNAEGIEATGERNDRMIVSSVGSSGRRARKGGENGRLPACGGIEDPEAG